MNSYEATRVVFSRLQSLDPDTASKTMGYILLHDAADDLLPSLALGPDSLLRDISLQAKSLLPNLSPKSPPPSYATVLNNNADDDDPYDSLPPSFLDDPPTSDLLLPLHRRSLSVPGGGGGGTCHYYARGFCKNGSSCRFSHSELLPGGDMVPGLIGSPRPGQLGEFDHCGGDFMKPRAAPSVNPKQYSLAAAVAANGNSNGSLPYNKCIDFLLQHQADFHPRSGSFGLHGLVNPSARQIYLTFPADSTFTEEDVSNYFSIYGPVQDVRIPYQQKRMFGFVTFLYSETVKLILAKGNPHFVCDSRVLVKPYKEKGKVVEKKHLQLQQLQLGRGDYSISPCSSPSGIDSRDPFDVPFGGGRMHYSNQEMLLRKKLEEEADFNFRQALELQSRRLMNLHLQDLKNHQHHHHYSHPQRHRQYQHDLSNGSPLSSPTVPRSPNFHFHNHLPSDSVGLEIPESDKGSRNPVEPNHRSDDNNGGKEKEESSNLSMESDHNESFEHILPDNLFGSPRKSATDHPTMFAAYRPDASENPTSSDMPMVPSSSAFSALPAESPALATEPTMSSVSL